MANQMKKVDQYSVQQLLAPGDGNGSKTIKDKFTNVLGKRAPQFMTSLINVVNSNYDLKQCDSGSVIASALVAAALDLPINQNLGYMYIVPYNHRATPQMGYKGYIQLAQRSGQYKHLNAIPVYADEFKSWNPLTEEIDYQPNFHDRDDKEKPVGYLGYMELLNGFSKTVFWTRKQIDDHRKHFSQAGGKGKDTPKGVWADHFDAMALKTVLRNLLTKWGPMTVDIQTASDAEDGLYDHLDEERKDVTPEDDSTAQTLIDGYNKAQSEEKPKKVEEASDNGDSGQKATSEADKR